MPVTKWVPEQDNICGVPICEQYKYLGTLLNTKLTCGPQIGHVKRKSAHLYSKLYPCLFHASAEGRRDMWQTMVAPLFNAALTLLYFEPSKSHRDNLERLQRCTFKQFLMVSKRTNTVLTEDMLRKDLLKLSQATVETSFKKWSQRKGYHRVTATQPNLSKKNGTRGVPNTWCKLVNTQVRPCPKCKTKGVVTSRWHLKYAHGEELPHINLIWREQLCPITEKKFETTTVNGRSVRRIIPREDVMSKTEPLILAQIEN